MDMEIEALKVDVRDSESDAWQKVLTIEVPSEELAEDYDAVLEDYQKRAALPGFRKGRVPRNVLELQFGHSLEHEVLERAVKRSYERAVREQNLEPVSYPAIDKIRFDKGKPLTYEAKVDIRPAVTPRDYFGLDIPASETAVGDDEVDKAMEELRQRTAEWVPVEREAGPGDAVLVDYVRLNAKGKPVHHSEQKDALVELDASGLLPEFRQNLLGKKTGDNANFSVTYPAEFGNEELRGKSVTFSLQVKGVRERKVRPLDDAFATEVVGMRDLLEDAIIRAERVTVTDEEIDQTLRGAAPEDAPPQEAERLLRSPAQRDRARAHLAERKLFALLRDKAQLKMAV